MKALRSALRAASRSVDAISAATACAWSGARGWAGVPAMSRATYDPCDTSALRARLASKTAWATDSRRVTLTIGVPLALSVGPSSPTSLGASSSIAVTARLTNAAADIWRCAACACNCGRMPRRSTVTRLRMAAAVCAASVGFAVRTQPPLHSRVDATDQLHDALPQSRQFIGRQGVKVGPPQLRQSSVQSLAEPGGANQQLG